MPDRDWYADWAKDWDGDPERTGWNPKWVESMPDLLCAESIAASYLYLAQLDTMPLAGCEALWGCPHPAGFYLSLHGCAELLICEYHLSEWMQVVLEALAMSRGAFCDECRLVYPSIERFMGWRLI